LRLITVDDVKNDLYLEDERNVKKYKFNFSNLVFFAWELALSHLDSISF